MDEMVDGFIPRGHEIQFKVEKKTRRRIAFWLLHSSRGASCATIRVNEQFGVASPGMIGLVLQSALCQSVHSSASLTLASE